MNKHIDFANTSNLTADLKSNQIATSKTQVKFPDPPFKKEY